jgi:hypothetical protein
MERIAHGPVNTSVDEDEGSLPRDRVNRQHAGKIERSADALQMMLFI